jgi:hypothetical protein
LDPLEKNDFQRVAPWKNCKTNWSTIALKNKMSDFSSLENSPFLNV